MKREHWIAAGIITTLVTFVTVVVTVAVLYVTSLPRPKPKPSLPFSILKMFAGKPEDARLNFTQLARKHGRSSEEFDVPTQDGYILKLFHLPGDPGRPVLLVHGFLDSADSFILRGGGSLSVALASAGYDVWVGNFRGNRYSRRHKELDPDRHRSFWDFSFHEFGVYDLPAIVDSVLRHTRRRSLQVVTHSVGGAAMLVMGSERPEYNDKIKMHVAMAPICYTHNVQPPLSRILAAESVIGVLLYVFGKREVFGSSSETDTFVRTFCSLPYIGEKVCLDGGFFHLTGRDDDELTSDFLPVIFGHYPAGTSMRNINHILQSHLKKTFGPYRHGVINALMSFLSSSPAYDLSKVTMKTVILLGANDKVSTLNDGHLLKRDLPNVVEYRVMERRQFNHVDFIWGENMKDYLFTRIFEVLKRYDL